MADPLSIAAGLTAVAEAAISTCKILFRTAKAITEARSRISDLAQNLTQFSSILNRLASVIESAPDVIGKDGIRDVNRCRRDCREIVREIKRVFENIDVKSLDFIARVKWLFKQDSLRYPRARLEAAKTNLLLNIEVLTLAVSIKAAKSNQTARVAENLESVKAFVASHEAAIAELRSSESEADVQAAQRKIQQLAFQRDDKEEEEEEEEEEISHENGLIREHDARASLPFAILRDLLPADVMESFSSNILGVSDDDADRKQYILVKRLLRRWTTIPEPSILAMTCSPNQDNCSTDVNESREARDSTNESDSDNNKDADTDRHRGEGEGEDQDKDEHMRLGLMRAFLGEKLRPNWEPELKSASHVRIVIQVPWQSDWL